MPEPVWSSLLVFSYCLLATVFLMSGVGKAYSGGQFRGFAESLRAMRLLGDAAVVPVSAAVVAAELAVPLLIAAYAVPGLSLAGLGLAAGLLASFTAAIIVVLRRGTPASCRCFGGSGAAPFGRRHVVRNLVLIAVAGGGAVATLRDPQVGWQSLVLGAAAGVSVALLVARLDDLVALFAPLPARP